MFIVKINDCGSGGDQFITDCAERLDLYLAFQDLQPLTEREKLSLAEAGENDPRSVYWYDSCERLVTVTRKFGAFEIKQIGQ